MILIGFGSKARQGKDVAAQAIQDHFMCQRDDQQLHGLPMTAPYVQRVGFADELYRVCREEYGMTTKDAPFLQKVGHGRRLEFGETYWIDKAFAKINPLADIVVIPDVRYWNEATEIEKLGGYTVQVSRYNADGTRYVANDRPADFPSEVALDSYPFNFRLVNSDGHQALLCEQAITLAIYLRGLHGKA